MPLPRTTLSILPLLALALACGSGEPSGAGADAGVTQNPEAAYAMGLMAARGLEQLQLSPAERAEFDRGIRDYEKGTPRVTLLRELSKLQTFQMERMNSSMERHRQQAEEFLRAAQAEAGAEKLESGIVVLALNKGEGATPKQDDRAVVRAEGTLPDGTLFFSSETQGPLSVNMLEGIPCLTEPLGRMSVGGKARITCPPHTGYAAQDKPVLILPGSALRFELELLRVMPAKGHGAGG